MSTEATQERRAESGWRHLNLAKLLQEERNKKRKELENQEPYPYPWPHVSGQKAPRFSAGAAAKPDGAGVTKKTIILDVPPGVANEESAGVPPASIQTNNLWSAPLTA